MSNVVDFMRFKKARDEVVAEEFADSESLRDELLLWSTQMNLDKYGHVVMETDDDE